MTNGGKLVVWLGSGFLFCHGVWAVTDNPYEGIVARNVFALKPPPAPVPIEEVKPPPSRITLTGITTILGRKQALMKTPPPAGKPGETAKGEQSYILGEGEREGDIEVVQIDEKAGTVKVKNGDVLMVLNFDKDGQKLVSTPLPAAQFPGAPPPGGGGLRPPSVNPYTQPASTPGFNLPARPLRAQPGTVNPAGAAYSPGSYSPGGYSPGGFGGVATPSVSAGGASLPLYGGANSAAQAQAAAQQPQMTPEEQIIHMEVIREINKNNLNFPPLPPTPLNPNPTGTAANPEQGTTTTTPGVPTPARLPGMPQQLPPMPQ